MIVELPPRLSGEPEEDMRRMRDYLVRLSQVIQELSDKIENNEVIE